MTIATHTVLLDSGGTKNLREIGQAMAALGGVGTVILPAGVYTIDGVLAVPPTLTLVLQNGAILSRASSGRVVVEGELDTSDRRQVLLGFSPGDVVLTNQEASIVWWGAGRGADDTSALQCAAAASRGMRIPMGNYLVSGVLDFPSHVQLTVEHGAMLVNGGASTIRVRGPVVAPRSQWLSGYGTNDVIFDLADDVDSSWWYAGLDAAMAAAAAAAAAAALGDRTTIALLPPESQSVYAPIFLSTSQLAIIKDRAYFCYLGYTQKSVTPKHIRLWQVNPGTGTQTAEVGLFSTPLPPNGTGQTLTLLAFDASLDNLKAGSGVVVGNTADMATAIPGQTHLWAGVRVSLSGSQPTFHGFSSDQGVGRILSLSSAAAFAAGRTYAANIITPASPWAWGMPALVTTLN